MFPNNTKFADALEPVVESKGIERHWKSQLVKIDKDNRVATLKNLDSGDLSTVDFDFLHFSPP
jgi:sulfide:quinone oxidoreductase